MYDEDTQGVISGVTNMVTRRNSVMTPLLVLLCIVGVLGVVLTIIGQQGFGAIFLIMFLSLVIYAIYRYETFSRSQPWMLSTTSVQKLGMLLTLGDNENPGSRSAIEGDLVENPKAKHTLESKKVRGKK